MGCTPFMASFIDTINDIIWYPEWTNGTDFRLFLIKTNLTNPPGKIRVWPWELKLPLRSWNSALDEHHLHQHSTYVCSWYIYIILCYYIYNYIYFYLYTYLLGYLHADLALSSVLCVCGKRNLLPVPPRLVPLKVGDGRCMVVPAGSVGVWPVWPPGGLAPPSIQPPSIAWLGFHHGASLTSSQAQGSFHWELEAETRQGMW